MDNLDWSNELEESLIMAASANGALYNNNTTPYSNQVQQVQKTDLLFSNAFPHWNSRSGPSSSWETTINGGKTIDYRTSMPVTLNSNAQKGSILDSSNSSGLIEQMNPGISTTTASFESLDCLLSASPSLTDTTTSVEDDGISLIFSDPKSMWNFSKMKSAPSFSSSSDITKPAKLIETISQTSNDHHIINRSSGSPNPNKRKRGGENSHEHPIKHQHLDFQSNNSKFQKKEKHPISSSNINFQQPSSSGSSADEPDAEAIAQMKEIIYRAAAFRPVNFGVEPVEKPRRKNVRISNDPQTVAARQRREKISERIRVLQKLVPGGTKMDTASMLDEAANYLKFLRSQVKALEAFGPKIDPTVNNFPVSAFSPFINYPFSMQQPQFSIHNPNPVNKS